MQDAFTGGRKIKFLTALGTTQINTECDAAGNSFEYSEVLDVTGNRRILSFANCPNHFSKCQRSGCSGDETRAFFKREIISVPLFPALRSTSPVDLKCSSDVLAIALNGVPISGRASATDCTDIYPEITKITDKCGGYADLSGHYRYRALPQCLLMQLSAYDIDNDITPQKMYHGPQIAWSLDGFPVYSAALGPNNIVMLPCADPQANQNYCLDSCNGFRWTLPGVDEYTYRYYIVGEITQLECSKTINSDINCENSNDPCCTASFPSYSEKLIPITIGCYMGCNLDEPECFASSVQPGITQGFNPKISNFVDTTFDRGASLQSEDISISSPVKYLPSFWDLVSYEKAEYFVRGSMLSVTITFTQEVLVIGKILNR